MLLGYSLDSRGPCHFLSHDHDRGVVPSRLAQHVESALGLRRGWITPTSSIKDVDPSYCRATLRPLSGSVVEQPTEPQRQGGQSSSCLTNKCCGVSPQAPHHIPPVNSWGFHKHEKLEPILAVLLACLLAEGFFPKEPWPEGLPHYGPIWG